MRMSPCGSLLPRGMTYDPDRKRFRIRLYAGDTVVWLSYQTTLDAALADYDEALATQQQVDLDQHTARGATGLAATLTRRA